MNINLVLSFLILAAPVPAKARCPSVICGRWELQTGFLKDTVVYFKKDGTYYDIYAWVDSYGQYHCLERKGTWYVKYFEESFFDKAGLYIIINANYLDDNVPWSMRYRIKNISIKDTLYCGNNIIFKKCE